MKHEKQTDDVGWLEGDGLVKLKKLMRRFKVVFSIMLVLALLQGYAALAAERTEKGRLEAYYMQLGEPSESGCAQEYYVDSQGNRISLDIGDETPESGLIATNAELPAEYDLRDEGRVTGVKNQGNGGICWSFAAIGAAESSLISEGLVGADIDLSEDHLAWFSAQKDNVSGDGADLVASNTASAGVYQSGAGWQMSTALLANGVGAESEELAPYYPGSLADCGNYGDSQRFSAQFHLKNTSLLANEHSASISNMPAIKRYIMDNGAVQMSYYQTIAGVGTSGTAASSYYQNLKSDTSHAVIVVGWDDNYSREKFQASCRPSGDGAWLVRNSYGSNIYDAGYMWISYYDESVSRFYGYEMTSADSYDNIYYYDGIMTKSSVKMVDSNHITMANVFTCSGNETLHAVSFYTGQNDVNYKVEIYRALPSFGFSPESGTRVSACTATGTVPYKGYRTVELSNSVSLNAGEKYSVIVTLVANDGSEAFFACEGLSPLSAFNSSMPYTSNEGESFYKQNDDWVDLSSGYNNACIKAFTDDNTSGRCGDGAIWSFNAADGVLSIGGAGAMTDFAFAADAPWFDFAGEIKEISVEGVSHIGANAFAGLDRVKSVDIPSGVTSLGNKAVGFGSDGKTVSDFVIYCAVGSAAGAYAAENRITAVQAGDEKRLTEIKIDSLPLLRCSYVGSALDTRGLSVSAVYSDGSVSPVTADISGFSSESAGRSKVTVTYSEGGRSRSSFFYNTVKQPAIFILPSAVVEKGASLSLSATASPSNCYVEWSVDNTEIITGKNASGVAMLTALSVGMARATAKITVNSLSYQAYCLITVTEPDVTVDIEDTIQLSFRDTYTLTPEIISTSGKIPTFYWSSSDTSVAVVDENGKVTALKRGTAVITVENSTGSVSDSCTVTVAYKWWQWIWVIFSVFFSSFK